MSAAADVGVVGRSSDLSPAPMDPLAGDTGTESHHVPDTGYKQPCKDNPARAELRGHHGEILPSGDTGDSARDTRLRTKQQRVVYFSYC